MKVSLCRLLAAAVAISLLASACGGGGGGGSAASTPAPAPAPAPEPTPEPTAFFTISGTVTASGSQVSDSDNNDPARESISNDTPATAQPIPNPITLGGYINEPGAGAAGRSQAGGDVDDMFRVELLAGQSVTMLVADFAQADADLYLRNTRGDIIDFSIETGEIESLIIPVDGTYLVNPSAFAGATNYILAIGASSSLARQSARHHNIVPWQSVVKYRESDPADAGPAHLPRDIAYRLGMEQRAGGPGRARLMALQRGWQAASRRSRQLGAVIAKKDQIPDPQLREQWETLITIKHLQRDPQIEFAQPNYEVRALAVPDDEAYPFQWHYPLISLPEAWDTTTGDPAVLVAVVDTGILSGHPDLGGQLVAGYDFVRNPASARDGDGIDPDPEDTGNSLGAGTDSFHGSHVSGTVAARSNNGRGVAGAAYSSRIMPLRALGSDGGGTSYDVDQAIRFAAGLPNDSGTLPPQAADIINLSLGGAPFIQATQNLLDDVRAAGVLIVAAAGNEASALPGYPASYRGVISVSAVDAQRRLAPYSNTGPNIDLAAPGGNNSEDVNGDGYPDGVLSTGGERTESGLSFEYLFLSGTSMAAPHVAGVLALMKSVNPALTPQDIDALLAAGDLSEDLGTPGRDDLYGHGLINAQRAVLAALEAGGSSPADNPRLVASASSLNFASALSTLDLFLDNGGKGELELLELTTSQAWLSTSPAEVDDNGLGLYKVLVDRSNLDAGVYAATIRAESSVNELSIKVLCSVGGEDVSADVGFVYILLYDVETDTVVDQFAGAGGDGNYPYRFDNVPAGRYEVLAGSDADNDLLICDPGEACGAWLTVDQPILLDLQTDATDIDFPVEYLVSLPNVSANAQAGPVPATPVKNRNR